MNIKYMLFAFLTIGTCIISVGIYFYQSTEQLIDSGRIVEGVVVRMKKERSSDGPDLHRAIVEYTDHKGKVRELYSASATYPPRYFEGEMVQVIYDPADPKYPLTAEINDFWNLYGGAIFLIGLGSVFILLPLTMFFFLYKDGPPKFVDSPEDGYGEY